MRRFGVMSVDDVHDPLETLEVLGVRRPRPSGRRLGAISGWGGECALLADRADYAGTPFAPLEQELPGTSTAESPNYLSPQNPLGAWAIDEAKIVYPCPLQPLARSGACDVLLAQVDLSRSREESSNGWCEMTVRALAGAVAGTPAADAIPKRSRPPHEA
jgi:hypothetical protein